MKRKVVFILCLLFITFAVCIYNFRSNEFITGNEAMEDYIYMWDTLEENYPLLETVEQQFHNKSTHTIRSYFYNLLKNNINYGKISRNKFFDIINKTLNTYNGYGHLYIVSEELYDMMYNVYVDNRSELPDTYIYDYISNVVSAERSKAAYQISEPKTNRTNSDKYTLNLEKEVDESIAFSISDATAIISINTFAWSDSECITIAVSKLREYCMSSKGTNNLIIDLRNNEGGSSRVWELGIVAPLIRTTLSYDQLYGYKNGKINCNIFNEESRERIFLTKEQVIDQYNIDPDDLGLSFLDKYFVNRITVNPDASGYEYSGNIWVLVDKHVYSAADAFAIFCKETGFATVVGQQTYGSGMGGEPLVFSLPNSGLLIRYDALYGLNKDGTSNSVNGTVPDIILDVDQDALEYVLDIINEF